MITCPKCGSKCDDLNGRLFNEQGILTQESFQCSNPKCGVIVDIPADKPA